MKTIGLDLGNKTLGIAISDIEGKFARGLETVRFSENDTTKALDRLVTIFSQEPVGTIVLGLPKNMDGSVGSQGQKSLTFKTMLETHTSIPIILWDERLSTRVAAAQMLDSNKNRKKRQTTIDQEAAAVILQSYLDIK